MAETDTPAQNNVNHAMGVLLVRLAKADDEYAWAEIARIDRLIQTHYGLNPLDAAKLRAECEQLEKQAGDTDAIAKDVRDHIALAPRTRFITALWQVSLADGVIRDEEADFIARVAEAAGVPKSDYLPA